jgi:hypothetical protein
MNARPKYVWLHKFLIGSTHTLKQTAEIALIAPGCFGSSAHKRVATRHSKPAMEKDADKDIQFARGND